MWNSTIWPRLALVLFCLALPLAAGAQKEEPEVVPDIFTVFNTGREIPGSLDATIESANAGSNTANTIRFGVGELEALTLTLESEPLLPNIDLLDLDPAVDRNVDLDATNVLGFRIDTATDVDVANYFQGAANSGWSLFGKYGFAHWINFGQYEGRNSGQ